TQGGGNAGIVSADVGSFSLTGGSKIDSSTTGSGNGGSISIKAGNQVNLDGYYRDSTGKDFSSAIQCISWAKDGGAGGSISVTTPRLSVSNKAGISTQTQGRGNAGSIVIDAGTVSLLSGAKIDSDSFASGNGGTITVKAYYGVLIEGLFQISNSGYSNSGMSASTSGSGKGGSIIISTPLMELRDNGSVSLDSLGSGTGGDMNLNVANLSLRDAASLSSQSRGTGKAGDITILGGNALSIHKSSVTTASANADGGTIRIETPLLDLFDCSVTATVRGGIGNGGNIDVSGSHIVVDRSKIIANADGGNGGNININTGLLLTSPDAVITASSRLGLQGTVDIKAPIVDVSSGLVSLPSSFMNILSLNPKQCASTEEEISSFTVTREGIPLRPDRFYPGR
ncbi:MAG TPA: hypothetical protein HPP76_07200, partial [Desulfuromonadales bacterium]|nr:hypothetical protein [Desulfuromonadales bacterium]